MVVRIKRTKVVGNGVAGLKSIPPKPAVVEVGFPAGETDSDVLERAFFNNFGTERIPERPFMQGAMRANRSSYRSLMISGAKEIVRAAAAGEDPKKVMRRVLRKLGVKAQGDIQEEITSLQSPPNAPSTIARKKSSNPLIETGELRASVTFKVKD
ncbi:hypothetical protein [Rhizobium rosettiformans]|uniref:hypothetical protein n=1 Tax=Rhizobium rosettiformans TaxID=1368430 RepID=UPI0028668508|nr:hypothetical protein [Rhizobium rosettiformans]MDR7027257.1 hypothetical protein [Rhizobium rosettiformans]MDR7065378.1 hypothetical protein [Rhizobium rosettiformans]